MTKLFIRIAAVLLLAGTVCAQDETSLGSNDINPFGFEFAQFLAERSPMEMTSIQNAWNAPQESVVVLLGNIPREFQSTVKPFIRAGGAVLVASDQTIHCDLFTMRSGPLYIRDANSRYRGHDDCFVVEPEQHALTQGVKQIIFNRSGVFSYRSSSRGGRWSVLGFEPNRNSPVLATYEQGTGRLVAMSDHSPFTNQMLTHGDNAILLVDTINWLKDGRRRNVAFIVDGDMQSDSGLPPILPEDEIPPIDPSALPKDTWPAIANRFLREAQNDNAFNRLLASIPPWRVRQVLIVLTTIFLGILVFRRLVGSRPIVKPPETNAANASEARAATMLNKKTLYPAAAELARGFVRELTGLHSTTVTPEIDKQLIWVAPGVSGSTSRVRTDVAKIARLAGGLDRPKRFKPKQFRKLAARIEELTAMFQAGQLRLQSQAATT